MSGTRAGAIKTSKTNKEKYGEDFYKEIGRKGGKKTMADGAKPKGFAAATPEQRAEWGAKGGAKSRK